MSQENLESTSVIQDLKQKHNEARAELMRYIYEEYEPRFYKHKVGRKQEPINGWKDIEERIKAEVHVKNLWDTWFTLYISYWKKTGEHLHLVRGYLEKESPDGPRFVKESAEEAASYETSLRKLRSPHLS